MSPSETTTFSSQDLLALASQMAPFSVSMHPGFLLTKFEITTRSSPESEVELTIAAKRADLSESMLVEQEPEASSS